MLRNAMTTVLGQLIVIGIIVAYAASLLRLVVGA